MKLIRPIRRSVNIMTSWPLAIENTCRIVWYFTLDLQFNWSLLLIKRLKLQFYQ